MRAVVFVVALAALVTGCAAEITGDSYYCGPEAACPPDLACDGETNQCVPPASATTFTCTEGPPIATATCGIDSLQTTGCVLAPDGHDRITLATSTGCTVQVAVSIAYPVAFMPLDVTVRDQDAVVVASAPCGGVHNGVEGACATFAGAPDKTYTIDVAAAAGAPTCGGACGFNRFAMTVQVTRP